VNQVTAITEVISRNLPEYGSREGTHDLPEDVVLAVVEDGTSRLLDLGGRFYGLSSVGSTKLTQTLRYGSEEAARRIATEYGVPFERVKSDIDQFLETLERSRLVERLGAGEDLGDRIRGLMFSGLLWPARLVKLAASPLPESARIWLLLTFAWLSLRLCGWASSVATLATLFPRLARPADPEKQACAVDRIDRLVRSAAAKHPLPVECKERSICCWVLLRVGGWPSDLVVGVDLFPFLGHCWCESGDRTISDDPHRCERFVPVLRYR
jgi:hypothetical protein